MITEESQSPDEDSLSSDRNLLRWVVRAWQYLSQSPDEDSLSSDPGRPLAGTQQLFLRLNPLTRIHCLPTKWLARSCAQHEFGLNPLTRIHCLPTRKTSCARWRSTSLRLNPLTRIHCLPTVNRCARNGATQRKSQSPDEDSLSSDLKVFLRWFRSIMSQSPDEDSLSSDTGWRSGAPPERCGRVSIP